MDVSTYSFLISGFSILEKFFCNSRWIYSRIYTIGGPFVLMGYKDYFSSKQELRSTMAGYFLL